MGFFSYLENRITCSADLAHEVVNVNGTALNGLNHLGRALGTEYLTGQVKRAGRVAALGEFFDLAGNAEKCGLHVFARLSNRKHALFHNAKGRGAVYTGFIESANEGSAFFEAESKIIQGFSAGGHFAGKVVNSHAGCLRNSEQVVHSVANLVVFQIERVERGGCCVYVNVFAKDTAGFKVLFRNGLQLVAGQAKTRVQVRYHFAGIFERRGDTGSDCVGIVYQAVQCVAGSSCAYADSVFYFVKRFADTVQSFTGDGGRAYGRRADHCKAGYSAGDLGK